MSAYGILMLFPAMLSDNCTHTIPEYAINELAKVEYIISEKPKTTRAHLKQLIPGIQLQKLNYRSYHKKTNNEEIPELLNPLFKGHDMAFISEAGAPCIADPGAELVEYAHQKGITVNPFVGPSSIFLALAASGLNAQTFSFCGYLPRDSSNRKNTLKKLEKKAINEETQIFMETPYRNKALFDDILKACKDYTKLCIAMNLTSKSENIITLTIGEWKKKKLSLHKVPCIFILGQ